MFSTFTLFALSLSFSLIYPCSYIKFRIIFLLFVARVKLLNGSYETGELIVPASNAASGKVN